MRYTIKDVVERLDKLNGSVADEVRLRTELSAKLACTDGIAKHAKDMAESNKQCLENDVKKSLDWMRRIIGWGLASIALMIAGLGILIAVLNLWS